MNTPFIKMHGLGNDFVVLDGRNAPLGLTARRVQMIADRKRGVGCDQLISLERSAKADVFMRIHNADGSEAGACGNAARCIASLVMEQTGRTSISIETVGGLLQAEGSANGMANGAVSVDMGEPRFQWQDIPLARAMDTHTLDYGRGTLTAPTAVNVGNPHVIFFVHDVDLIPLESLGPQIETDPLFPERVNVNVAEIIDKGHIRLRVWERGAGLTLACGTGACATLVGAARRGLANRCADVALPGGTLTIEWGANNRMTMTGPVAESFRGELASSLLAGTD